jgi:hypothetical protein
MKATFTGVQIVRISETSDVLLLVQHVQIKPIEHSLCTPILNDATKDDLLRIISNIGTKTIQNMLKMFIAKSNNFGDKHGRLE